MRPQVTVLKGAFQEDIKDLCWGGGMEPTGELSSNSSAIILSGGTDISPSLYDEVAITATERPDNGRDAFELKVWSTFKGQVPLIGICRGAQLLNVLNGGKLWQDCDGHYNDHSAKILKDNDTFKNILITSIHHQMMRVTKKAEILVVSEESSYREAEGSNEKFQWEHEENRDIEAVYYPDTKSFCIQSHPEIGGVDEQEFFYEFLQDRFNIL